MISRIESKLWHVFGKLGDVIENLLLFHGNDFQSLDHHSQISIKDLEKLKSLCDEAIEVKREQENENDFR